MYFIICFSTMKDRLVSKTNKYPFHIKTARATKSAFVDYCLLNKTHVWDKYMYTYLLFWEIRKTVVSPVHRCGKQNLLSSDSRDIVHSLRSYFLHRKIHGIYYDWVSSWCSTGETPDANTWRNIPQCLKFEGNIPHNPNALSLPHHLLNANSQQQHNPSVLW